VARRDTGRAVDERCPEKSFCFRRWANPTPKRQCVFAFIGTFHFPRAMFRPWHSKPVLMMHRVRGHLVPAPFLLYVKQGQPKAQLPDGSAAFCWRALWHGDRNSATHMRGITLRSTFGGCRVASFALAHRIHDVSIYARLLDLSAQRGGNLCCSGSCCSGSCCSGSCCSGSCCSGLRISIGCVRTFVFLTPSLMDRMTLVLLIIVSHMHCVAFASPFTERASLGGSTVSRLPRSRPRIARWNSNANLTRDLWSLINLR